MPVIHIRSARSFSHAPAGVPPLEMKGRVGELTNQWPFVTHPAEPTSGCLQVYTQYRIPEGAAQALSRGAPLEAGGGTRAGFGGSRPALPSADFLVLVFTFK